MESREAWDGCLRAFDRGECTETLAVPVQQAETGAFPFLGVTTSGKKFWIKTVGNPHGDHSLAAEQIVSAVGRLIGAPVRPTALIQIGDGLEDWKHGDGRLLRAGIGHGSLLLEGDPMESDILEHLNEDDNRRRQPAIIALWEWCLGQDAQWLYAHSDENSIWSFDHDCWFDGHERPWTAAHLTTVVNSRSELLAPPTGMDPDRFSEVADVIEAVQPNQLLEAVAAVPEAWPIETPELETVAWFLYARRRTVADSLRRFAMLTH